MGRARPGVEGRAASSRRDTGIPACDPDFITARKAVSLSAPDRIHPVSALSQLSGRRSGGRWCLPKRGSRSCPDSSNLLSANPPASHRRSAPELFLARAQVKTCAADRGDAGIDRATAPGGTSREGTGSRPVEGIPRGAAGGLFDVPIRTDPRRIPGKLSDTAWPRMDDPFTCRRL